MRRAVLAILLCAAPLTTAPAYASPSLAKLQALRQVSRLDAGAASSGGVAALPLRGEPSARASSVGELARIARTSGRVHLLVGVRRHADLAGVTQLLRDLGATPESFPEMGVLAATAPGGTSVAGALGRDPRVAFVERNERLRMAVDSLDTVDPATGYKYTWAYDAVRAGEALAATGGGSRRTIAVVDTGLDVAHPEFIGRIAGTYDTFTKSSDVTDTLGHGTFVTGLITAIDGNGLGIKGVAGNTRVYAVRASKDGGFTTRDLLRGIAYAIRHGADVLNLSLAGPPAAGTATLARALAVAFLNDVLPVAASGNTGSDRNQLQFPAAVLGGSRGRPGIGLSVAAVDPKGRAAGFSTHNRYVSLAGPGAMRTGCEYGVVSTLPSYTGTEWDIVPPGQCRSVIVPQGPYRFAYGQGTSFSAPIVSGVAALAWQVEPRLASEQVAEVLIRSARQTRGRGWNPYTGAGVVDAAAATALARTFDVISPPAKGTAHRRGGSVSIRVKKVVDRTDSGHRLAGHVRYGLLVSRDGGRGYNVLVSSRRRPFRMTVPLRGSRPNVFAVTACDANGNCGVKRLGRFRP
jgi:subtilisin family serine protease